VLKLALGWVLVAVGGVLVWTMRASFAVLLCLLGAALAMAGAVQASGLGNDDLQVHPRYRLLVVTLVGLLAVWHLYWGGHLIWLHSRSSDPFDMMALAFAAVALLATALLELVALTGIRRDAPWAYLIVLVLYLAWSVAAPIATRSLPGKWELVGVTPLTASLAPLTLLAWAITVVATRGGRRDSRDESDAAPL